MDGFLERGLNILLRLSLLHFLLLLQNEDEWPLASSVLLRLYDPVLHRTLLHVWDDRDLGREYLRKAHLQQREDRLSTGEVPSEGT